MPKYINDRTGVNGAGSGVGEREMRMNGGEYGRLDYQERVTVIWIEKVKSMGPCTLGGVEGRRGSAEERVIFTDVSNIGMFERVNQATSNPPVIVISSNIRTLGNGDSNRGRMIRVVRHTLGRRDSC